MNAQTETGSTMRTVRFHAYGVPADVLRLEEAPVPAPGADRIRVRVHACGLNPADWALCGGLFPGNLPRGIGLEVSGIVDAVGQGVADVKVGDRVLGATDFAGSASAGASDHAILNHWAHAPAGLDLDEAAALPMAMETAVRSLAWLDVGPQHKLLVNGGGTMVGFAAVQIALRKGAQVITTAGETYARRLRDLGATVTSYGDGIVERVRQAAGGAPDLVFDAAPSNLMPDPAAGEKIIADLVEAAGGDARRVLSVNFVAAQKVGARGGIGEAGTGPGGAIVRYDVLDEYARLAAAGRFTIPIARKFPLDAWREALEVSLSGEARGKLLLIP